MGAHGNYLATLLRFEIFHLCSLKPEQLFKSPHYAVIVNIVSIIVSLDPVPSPAFIAFKSYPPPPALLSSHHPNTFPDCSELKLRGSPSTHSQRSIQNNSPNRDTVTLLFKCFPCLSSALHVSSKTFLMPACLLDPPTHHPQQTHNLGSSHTELLEVSGSRIASSLSAPGLSTYSSLL